MKCPHCGNSTTRNAKFCASCGKPLEPAAATPRPRRQAAGDKREEMPKIIRVILLLCAVISILYTTGTLVVDVYADTARAYDVKTRFVKKKPSGSRNEYNWNLTYKFQAAGTEYSGSRGWRGTRWAADRGWSKKRMQDNN